MFFTDFIKKYLYFQKISECFYFWKKTIQRYNFLLGILQIDLAAITLIQENHQANISKCLLRLPSRSKLLTIVSKSWFEWDPDILSADKKVPVWFSTSRVLALCGGFSFQLILFLAWHFYCSSWAVEDPDEAFGRRQSNRGGQKGLHLLKYQRLSAKIVVCHTKEILFCRLKRGYFCWSNYGIFQGITTV